MSISEQKEPLHLWLRRIYFMAAGAVACSVLAGMALQSAAIPWPAIGAITVIGVIASTTDVLRFEQHASRKTATCLFWLFGFAMLCFILWIGLLIPYFILAAISIACGVWQAWESAGPAGQWLAIPIGAGFGLLIWHLLDDY